MEEEKKTADDELIDFSKIKTKLKDYLKARMHLPIRQDRKNILIKVPHQIR